MSYPSAQAIVKFANLHQAFVRDCKHHLTQDIEPGKLNLLYHLCVVSEVAVTAEEMWDFQCTVSVDNQGFNVHPIDKYSQIIWRNVKCILHDNNMDEKYEYSKHSTSSSARSKPRDGGISFELSHKSSQRS